MNERIKQLAIQCYETGPIGKDGWPEYSKFNEEKFAELIVNECAEVGYRTHDDFMVKVKIKEHFGVEE